MQDLFEISLNICHTKFKVSDILERQAMLYMSHNQSFFYVFRTHDTKTCPANNIVEHKARSNCMNAIMNNDSV